MAYCRTFLEHRKSGNYGHFILKTDNNRTSDVPDLSKIGLCSYLKHSLQAPKTCFRLSLSRKKLNVPHTFIQSEHFMLFMRFIPLDSLLLQLPRVLPSGLILFFLLPISLFNCALIRCTGPLYSPRDPIQTNHVRLQCSRGLTPLLYR